MDFQAEQEKFWKGDGWDPRSRTAPCTHCWHMARGPLWEALPDGFVKQECCHCHKRQSIHCEHAR